MMRHSSLRLLWAAGFVVFACFAGGAADLRAQSAGGAVSCNEFLVPRVEVKGKQVGQESCQMIESDLDFQGRKFRRLDMGISGTVAGYTLRAILHMLYSKERGFSGDPSTRWGSRIQTI